MITLLIAAAAVLQIAAPTAVTQVRAEGPRSGPKARRAVHGSRYSFRRAAPILRR